MKRNIILALCLFPLCAAAQTTLDSVILRVHYTSDMRWRTSSKDLDPDEKILDIGHQLTHFYSRWEERNEDIHDSVFGHGGSLLDYNTAIDRTGFPKPVTAFSVFMNCPRKDTLMFVCKNLKYFRYLEPMEQPKWTLEDGDTTLVDYPCKKAVTTFRGRTWTVWYAPDIPYHYGPWKLYGLPGLILAAHDAKGDFFFCCIGLETHVNQPIRMRKAKYIDCSRKEFEDIERLSESDPDAFIAKMGFPKVVVGGGRPNPERHYVPCFLELDDIQNK
jgi:GLPGLI family protein